MADQYANRTVQQLKHQLAKTITYAGAYDPSREARAVSLRQEIVARESAASEAREPGKERDH